MAKRTAIIDIGSSSGRLVIYERTSRFGFHLICEEKSKVRIGEGAYAKGGNLQPVGIERAYLALQSFVQTTKKYRASKTLCVATSALRDAPNGQEFVRWIRSELGLNIKIIDGDEEAMLGAIAISNLLPVSDGITIDIGGGSSDLSLVKNGKIIETCSLNVGTVRIKELFFDRDRPLHDAQKFIQDVLKKLPNTFRHHHAIAIGGTARALSKGIMKSSDYPLDKIHAFEYKVKDFWGYLTEITHSEGGKKLKHFNLKKERYDTIREGTLIFTEIIKQIHAQEIITSGVGVREGLFLKDLLRHNNFQFPSHINPSIVSILDRFDTLLPDNSSAAHRIKIAKEIYRIFHQELGLSGSYQKELTTALMFSNIGKTLTIYKSHQHAFYITMQELNFDFKHKEMLLIALLQQTYGGSLLNKPFFKTYEQLLPPKEGLRYLIFIYSLTVLVHENSNHANIYFTYRDKTLTIYADQSLYHAKEQIALLEKPSAFDLAIVDKNKVPPYRF